MTSKLPEPIGPFSTSSDLILTPAPNGGWIISEKRDEYDTGPKVLGAFSTTSDMLRSLEFALANPVVKA
jgi:hypothetical protein